MKIIALLNSYTQGKSGGDMCFIQTFRRFKDIDLSIVTSQLGRQLCEQNDLKANFIITTKEPFFNHIVITYLKRSLLGFIKIQSLSSTDIIYSTSDALPDILPSIWLKIINPHAKLVCKIFHLIPQERWIPFFAQQISLSLIKRFSELIIVDNNLLQKELVNRKFIPKKIEIIYPAIDSDPLNKIELHRKYTATFMGRLHESKGIEDLIEICGEIVKKDKSFSLAIIGTGDSQYIDHISNKIKTGGLDNNIFLLGHLLDTEAYSLMKGSKMFLFPSHEEGFGMVVGEALALQLPVITYALPVYQETFSEILIQVPCFQKNFFVEKIKELLHNPQKYAKVIAKDQAVLKKFSWDKAAQTEFRLLQSLIHKDHYVSQR